MTTQTHSVQAILISCGSFHLRQTAQAYYNRNALAGLYISDRNSIGIPRHLYHRCWPFQLAMKPFHLWSRIVPPHVTSPMFWKFQPIWDQWLKHQSFPSHNVVQALGPYAAEAFEKSPNALKVYDSPSTHPLFQQGMYKNEFKKWGGKIPRHWEARREKISDCIKQADLVLCPSLHVRETMIAHGVQEHKCILAPFGVQLSTFHADKGATLKEKAVSEPTFLCCGLLSYRKGHPYLFRAFELLKKTHPEAKLVCVGPCRDEFKKEFKKFRHYFSHIPQLPQAELAYLMQNCTAFVFPTLEEGYARVIIESLACGLPVITTHESGATTDITHEKEGLIIPAGDAKALHMAMKRILEENELLTQLRENAQNFASGFRRSWQDYGDLLLREVEKKRLNRPPKKS